MRYGTILAALAALALSAGGAEARVKPGDKAPPFTITTFDHQKLSSSDLHGRVVVLNYWATWCTPCKAEMLVFDHYVRTHYGNDVRIYAVATEDSIPDAKLKPLAGALAFPLASKLSGHGFGVMDGVPTSYVIDRAGVVRHAQAGAFDRESFDALMGELLAEPASGGTVVAARN
jgi:cytochrome c biogenesis protein CcmG/thiol:disulfide interchange protein DsbE